MVWVVMAETVVISVQVTWDSPSGTACPYKTFSPVREELSKNCLTLYHAEV